MTGTMTYKFTYNVNSYYGRLVRVTDVLAGIGVVIRRDYRLHALHLTTMTTAGARRHLNQSQRQQRCHVTTDSNGLLASLSMPSSVTTWFSYMRDTGLLTSRRTAGDLYMYKYGRDGRVTSIVYATGAQCLFTSSLYNDTVHVSNSCDKSRVELTQSNDSLHVHCSTGM